MIWACALALGPALSLPLLLIAIAIVGLMGDDEDA